MEKITCHLIRLFTCACLVATAPQAECQDFDAAEAYAQLLSQIQNRLGFKEGPRNGNDYLAIAATSEIVLAGDAAKVNNMADLIPGERPVITSFNSYPKLSTVYEFIFNSLTGPKFTPPQDYLDAQTKLYDAAGEATVLKKAYDAMRRKVAEHESRSITAATAAERAAALLDLQEALEQWEATNRPPVDAALALIGSFNYLSGNSESKNRQDLFRLYRQKGFSGSVTLPTGVVSYTSPLSTFSPPPDQWEKLTTWNTVTFKATHTFTHNKYSSRSRSAFGGLSLGFVNIGGSGGGENSTTTKVSRVKEIECSFSLNRVTINRDWLDTRVFFEPLRWTWKQKSAESPYPLVATGQTTDVGDVLVPEATKYLTQNVFVPMIPKDFVIAKDVKIKITTSKADYELVKSSSQAKAAGSFLGIFGGGGGGKWASSNETITGDNVSFEIKTDGIGVIGVISQLIPKLPAPATDVPWPPNSWLPPQ